MRTYDGIYTMSSTNDDISVGLRLRETRLSKGLSQKQFAESIGLSLRAYQNYERGERPIAKEALLGLFTAHNVSPIWVLTGVEEQATPASNGKEIDLNTLNKVISALKGQESQLKNFRLEHVLEEIVGVYNSVIHCSDPKEMELVLRSQLRLLNQFYLKAGVDDLKQDAESWGVSEQQVEPQLEEMKTEVKKLRRDDRVEDTNIEQNFHAKVKQVAGRDINNKK